MIKGQCHPEVGGHLREAVTGEQAGERENAREKEHEDAYRAGGWPASQPPPPPPSPNPGLPGLSV